jgi:hypothetical protein
MMRTAESSAARAASAVPPAGALDDPRPVMPAIYIGTDAYGIGGAARLLAWVPEHAPRCQVENAA